MEDIWLQWKMTAFNVINVQEWLIAKPDLLDRITPNYTLSWEKPATHPRRIVS